MWKITYKHWKTGKPLQIVGTLPEQYNNSASDRFVVLTNTGEFEDVIKTTILNIEKVSE